MSNVHTLIENRFNNTNKLIFLATSLNDVPYIRAMTPYYHEGSFYFISSLLSEKIKHIEINNKVALCGEWFNTQGLAYIQSLNDFDESLQNNIINHTGDWIKLGHVDLNDKNTCIIQVILTDGYIIENKTKYPIKKL